MSKIPLKNIGGESVGEYEVADNLLVLDKGDQAVHEAVVAYNAHQRAGTASTLSKSNVSGTGAKPWKQKGLGRARAGYKQSPIWRGGAVAHGPHPRKYHKKVGKKVGQLAFQRAFSAKVDQGEITVIENLAVTTPKTKEFSAVLKNLGLDRGALFGAAVAVLHDDVVFAKAGVHPVQGVGDVAVDFAHGIAVFFG